VKEEKENSTLSLEVRMQEFRQMLVERQVGALICFSIIINITQ